MNLSRNNYDIVADGNCLFRSFSLFLFDHQSLYSNVRRNVVNYIVNNWVEFNMHIVGNSDYFQVSSAESYFNFMNRSGIFGSEAEIFAFSRMCNVYVTVHCNDEIFNYGDVNSSNYLTLSLTGTIDHGHYSVLQYKRNIFCTFKNDKPNHQNQQSRKRPLNDNSDEHKSQKNKSKKSKLKSNANQINGQKCSFMVSNFGEMNYVCQFCHAVYWK